MTQRIAQPQELNLALRPMSVSADFPALALILPTTSSGLMLSYMNSRLVDPLLRVFILTAAEMTDEAMTVFLLRQLRASIPFLICSDRLQRKYLKHVLSLFGQAQTKVRVQAVLFLRQMAVTLPPPFLSLAMKVSCNGSFVEIAFKSLTYSRLETLIDCTGCREE